MITDQQIHDAHRLGGSIRTIADDLHVSKYRVEKGLRTFHSAETRRLENARALGGNIAGGRITLDNPKHAGISGLSMVMPDDEDSGALKYDWMESDHIQRMPVSKILEMAIHSSPELSRGLWDYLRLVMPGWEATAFLSGTRDPDPAAQAVIDAFHDTLKRRHGAVEVPLAGLMTALFVRGAICAELVLSKQGVALELATPDPATIRFRRRDDPEIGTVWEMGQYQGTKWITIDRPTVRYIPVDRMPGRPYGRSPMVPALFPAIFLLGFYQDLKRVVANQGYPRLDLTVDLEAIYGLLSGGDEKREADIDPAEIKELLAEVVAMTMQSFSALMPGDTYVHSSLVKVNQPVGTLNAGSMGMIQPIIESLERMCVRALKTMPLLMGITDGVSEANANRQWEIHAEGIASMQHYAENLLESLYEVMLQAAGILADVEFRFAELRAAEALRDAQTESLTLDNIDRKLRLGLITPNEAATEALGYVSDAVALAYGDPDGAATEILFSASAGNPATDPATVNPEPGGDRAVLQRSGDVRQTRDLAEPVRSADLTDAIAWFDRRHPDYEGLLVAEVIEPEEDDERTVVATLNRAPEKDGAYTYDPDRKRYIRSSTAKAIHLNTVTSLRNGTAADAGDELAEVIVLALGGDTTTLQARLTGEQAIQHAMLANYLLGIGGVGMITADDRARAGQLIAAQYGYWRSFVDEAVVGTVSEAQARARAAMYGGASTEAFERARAAAYRVYNEIPHYPTQTACGSNCRCSLSFEETSRETRVYWRRSAGVESCPDCITYATEMNPFVVSREVT